MSKLPPEHKFVDLSDYGRPFAKIIAYNLRNTSLTAIDLTLAFIASGILAIFCIIQGYFWLGAFFLIFKSILDAADGELARIKETPSYTGRYLDSVADIVLNALFLLSIWYITESSIIIFLLAFIGIQLQGTLYNYYYVIMRTHLNGDTTSRIIENETPTALEGEKQSHVNLLFKLYKICYGPFDKTIYRFDSKAAQSKKIPKLLMTSVSILGLGFQLLIMSVMLILELQSLILPFFVGYTLLVFLFIMIRRTFLQ